MRNSAVQLTSVGLARTCPNKEIDNIVLVRLWVCACVCVCVFMGGGLLHSIYHTHLPYISSEQAALFGLSNLCPLSRRLGRETGSTPG